MLYRFLCCILILLLTTDAAVASAKASLRPQIADAVNSLYEANHGRQLWVRSGRPIPAARTALRILSEARSHGLDDELYGIDLLHFFYERLTQGSAQHTSDFELSLTLGLLRLIGDLRPAAYAVPLEGSTASPLTTAMLEAVNANRLEQFFQQFFPRDPQYHALREPLQTYEIRTQYAPGIIIGEGPKLVLGDVGPRVARLRARLLGDDDPTLGEEARSSFDAVLENAVRDYQEANGLTADGIAGSSTVRHLDMSDRERIARIKLNLARWRDLPVDLGRDHTLVNIPEFRLRYVRGQEQRLSMRVVVGSKSTPTPEIYEKIEYLVFNPYWYVPQSIVRKELLPRILENDAYLDANRYELLANGEAVSPADVDLRNVDFSRFPYRVRQKPGSQNALGTIKFLFPNPLDIYLHDSPAKNLFARPARAFSHGCIRLENPDLLAKALLAEEPDWTESKISSTITSGVRHQLNLRQPVPVYLAYFSVRVLDNGDVAFFEDIYNRDSVQLEKYM